MIGALRLWFAAVLALLLVVGGLIVWSLAPDLEARLSPVLGATSLYEQVPQSDGTIQFRFKTKILKSCTRLAAAWYGILPSGESTLADVRSMTPDLVGRPRPLGENISTWNLADRPGTYLLRLDYHCGWPWVTRATAGPFKVG